MWIRNGNGAYQLFQQEGLFMKRGFPLVITTALTLVAVLTFGCFRFGLVAGGPTLISVDISKASHTISPLLFGDQIEWLNSGNGIWDAAADAPHQELVDGLSPLGLTLLRYPAGTPSDFFHWSEAVGEPASRTGQINPWKSTTGNIVTELPVFGPDEFAWALRGVDSAVKVGLIGCHDTGLFPICDDPDWNRIVPENIGEKADFMAVHNSYAPVVWNYDPVPSAFYHVFRLYAEAASGRYVPTEVTNSPTFNSMDYGIIPAQTSVPALHAISALSPSSDCLWIYVVNRDLAQDIPARIIIDGFPAQNVQSVTAEVLNGPDYTSVNTQARPDTVTLATIRLLPSSDFTHTFPAHSLTRITIKYIKQTVQAPEGLPEGLGKLTGAST